MKVIITGITGQDGSYMAEYCLRLGHQVFGMVRRTSQIHDKNFNHLFPNPNFKMVYGDLLDSSSLDTIVQDVKPDYFINFASQSFVGVSWKIPEETFMAGAVGVLKCLEAIRKYAPACRFYNAGSSEQFGDVIYAPQDENHPFRPRSPYGAAKASAHFLTKVYRESYNLYAVQGLLFNHESERRGEEFVTRKVTKGIARILKSIINHRNIQPIELGNIYAKRDWSHAEDFVDGVWRMLNQDTFRTDVDLKDGRDYVPYLKEYVLASGESHTIKEFIDASFAAAHMQGYWDGEGVQEKFYLNDALLDQATSWRWTSNLEKCPVVVISKDFYRPNEVATLLGNPAMAEKELGWKRNISFDNLAKRMILYDLNESGIVINDPSGTVESLGASERAVAHNDNAR